MNKELDKIVENLQEAIPSLCKTATEHIVELKSAIVDREKCLAYFSKYSHDLFNSYYSELKEHVTQLEVVNSKLSISVGSLKSLQKTSTSKITPIKQSNEQYTALL